MREQVYVDRLFSGYEATPEIEDFKEEIAGNLKERIRELISKGLEEEAAFDKATAELGDITAIADEAGRRKRNEAIGQMYMKARVPVTRRTAAGLTAASGLLLLALGLALIAFFGKTRGALLFDISAILLALSCGLYTYYGLTQETAARYAMGRRRALAYGLVCCGAVLGVGLAVTAYLVNGFEMSVSIGIKTALMLPAICALIFLLVTEPKRHKPWLRAMVEQEIENSMRLHQSMVDPVKAARYGVTSGGLWVLAVAVFMTLGFVSGWHYAWLVFPFALAIQIFMTATIFEKRK